MADDFTIAKGATTPSFRFQLIPASGQSFTLTGAAVALRAWAKSQSTDKIAWAACAVEDAVALFCRYDWQPQDTDTKEGYRVQVRVTFPGGAVAYFPNKGSLVLRVTP